MSTADHLPPTTFTDAAGRTWSCAIDWPIAFRVRRQGGVRLDQLVQPPGPQVESEVEGETDDQVLGRCAGEFIDLAGDPVALIAVLWLVVQGQHAGASGENFAMSMTSAEVLIEARAALAGGLAAFLRSIRRQAEAMV